MLKFSFKVNDEPLFDKNATPTQVPGVDIDSLEETPSSDEFFLYSRIDGRSTVKQLCTTSGLGREKTLEALESLVKVGLIEVEGYEPPDRVRAEQSEGSASEATSDSDPSEGASTGTSGEDPAGDGRDSRSTSDGGLDLSHLPIPPCDFDFPEELLELDVPIADRKRRELICLHEQLEGLNYYQFFGVPRDAERGTLKKAYFELSKRFHPDKHFRKKIGPFSEMLETVFQTITRGYRVLSDPQKRAEYDADLKEKELGDATPMAQPSQMHMANEGASERADADDGADKRNAAFTLLVRRGEKLGQKGKHEQAAQQFRKALSLKRDRDVAMTAARLLKDSDEYLDQAALFARAALRIDDTDTEARLLLGAIFEQRGNADRASDLYETILERDETHAEARRRLEALEGGQDSARH